MRSVRMGVGECVQRCASGCVCNEGQGVKEHLNSADAPKSIVVLVLLPVLVELLIQMLLLHFAHNVREELIRRQLPQLVLSGFWLLGCRLPVVGGREG